MNPRQFVVFSRVLYAVDPIDFFTQKHLMRRQVETNPITMTFHRATQTFLTGLLCFLMLAPTWTSAEGTKQTTATATDRTHLLMNFSEYNDFGRYNGTVDQRLFIHIENPENIQLYHVQNIKEQLYSGNIHPSNGITATHTSWVMDQILRNGNE